MASFHRLRIARGAAVPDFLADSNFSAAFLGKVDSRGMSRPFAVGNSLSWERNEFCKIEERWVRVSVPSMGYVVIDLDSKTPDYFAPAASSTQLENDILRVRFNADGSLASVFDKEHGREALAAGGGGNRLAVYHDPGHAWDFPMDFDQRPPEFFVLKAAEAGVDGPRAWVRQTYDYGASVLTQEVSLVAGSRRLDFRTEVDWRESERMLRTSFPVAVQADDAVCEIQFGNIRRPTHRNTSWDKAKFEVCCHKWMDLSDCGYGVAVLNNGKYGHKALENVLDINLLRSPGYPDPTADRALHEFAYSLYPHAGDYGEGGVIRAAYELNVPLRVTALSPSTGSLPGRGSFLSIDAPNVVIESVKKAEDSEVLIMRLYEAHGSSTVAELRLAYPQAKVDLVDLLEEHPLPLDVCQGRLMLGFKPFEIHTLKITPP